jgi:hypothetical protein
MSNSNANKLKQPAVYDTRVIQRNQADGTVSADDVKNHLTNLPDVAGKSQPFDTSLRGFERDDEDDDGDGDGEEG